MIKLTVEGYCQECPWFEPETIKSIDMRPTKGRTLGTAQTEVVCKIRERCALLALRIVKGLCLWVSGAAMILSAMAGTAEMTYECVVTGFVALVTLLYGLA